MCHFWLGYTGHDDVREIFLGIFYLYKKGLFVKFSWEFFRAKKETLVTDFFVGENWEMNYLEVVFQKIFFGNFLG
jgi:hypothetical protein